MSDYTCSMYCHMYAYPRRLYMGKKRSYTPSSSSSSSSSDSDSSSSSSSSSASSVVQKKSLKNVAVQTIAVEKVSKKIKTENEDAVPEKVKVEKASKKIKAEVDAGATVEKVKTVKSDKCESDPASSDGVQSALIGEWNEDNEFIVDLEKDKKEVAKIKVRKFNDNVYIDLRKYYDNGSKPTLKGVSLKPELFTKLVSLKPIISEAVELVEMKRDSMSPQYMQQASVMRDDKGVTVSIELDRGHMVKVSMFKKMMLVDIRNYYNGGPTKKGISVDPALFTKVVNWGEWKAAVDRLSK